MESMLGRERTSFDIWSESCLEGCERETGGFFFWDACDGGYMSHGGCMGCVRSI